MVELMLVLLHVCFKVGEDWMLDYRKVEEDHLFQVWV